MSTQGVCPTCGTKIFRIGGLPPEKECGGMALTELKRLKALEEDNARLKRIVAQQAVDIDVLKEIN